MSPAGRLVLPLVVAGALTSLSCTPVTSGALELDKGFSETGVEGRIVVMRVEDARRGRFELVGVEQDVHKAAMRLLPAKGYPVLSYRIEVRPQERESARSDRAARLYISVEEAAVEDSERGRVYRVRVSARLVGPDSVLWRDSAVGRSGFSGLLVALSRPSSRYEAAHEAVADLFDTLPPKPAGAAGGPALSPASNL